MLLIVYSYFSACPEFGKKFIGFSEVVENEVAAAYCSYIASQENVFWSSISNHCYLFFYVEGVTDDTNAISGAVGCVYNDG
jgi:hypothetical protein